MADEFDLKMFLLEKEPLEATLEDIKDLEAIYKEKDIKIPGLASIKRWLSKELKRVEEQYKKVTTDIAEEAKDIAKINK